MGDRGVGGWQVCKLFHRNVWNWILWNELYKMWQTGIFIKTIQNGFFFLQNLKTAPVNWMQTLRVEREWELESWEVELRWRGVTSGCLPYCTVFAPPLHQRSLHRRAQVPKHLPPPSASSHVAPLGRLEGCEKNGRAGGGGGRKRRGTEQTEREPIAEPHVSGSLGFQWSTAGGGKISNEMAADHTSTTGRSGRACWERKQRERQRTYTRTAGQLVLPRRDWERSPLLPRRSAGGMHLMHRSKNYTQS